MVQRFGSALNLNLHFHILCLDGVYVREAEGLRFVRDHQVTTEEVATLVVELATRAERWLSRQGFGADDGEEEHGYDDDALLLMQAASVQGRSAVAGGRRARRFQVHRGRACALLSRLGQTPQCSARAKSPLLIMPGRSHSGSVKLTPGESERDQRHHAASSGKVPTLSTMRTGPPHGGPDPVRTS